MSESKQKSQQDLKSPTSQKREGARIGPYSLGKTLGVGSTGKVKLGTHSETGQRVAVKIISKASMKREKDSAEDSTNKKLEREIAIMKLVQHPNVMNLYDVFESTEDLYLVLELVEGGELFDYLVKQGRLKENEALKFFHQIIAGLDYCHKHLICHRDLKPENLLLDSNKNIKLADFGMASLQVSGKLLETSCGSPHYASPEIIKGIKYDGAAADVWSTGVILFALLTGSLPFDDDNIRKLLQKVKTGIFKIPDFVPTDAADLVTRMLTVNPEKRITIREIIEHRWFAKRPYNGNADGPLRSPPGDQAMRPLTSEEIENVDMEILSSLKVLGYGSESTIVEALKDPMPNYEKVFYWLLTTRRNEYLENFEPEKDWWYSEKGARRRVTSQSSRTSLVNERSSMYGSTATSTGDLELKYGSKASSDKELNDNKRQSTGSLLKQEEQQRARLASESSKRKSYNPSPLSAHPGAEPFTAELSNKAKEVALKALEGRRSPAVESPSPVSDVSKRSSVIEQFRTKMTVSGDSTAVTSIVSNDGKSPESQQRKSTQGARLSNVNTTYSDSDDQVDRTSTIGTPKFHRRYGDASASPATPVGESTSQFQDGSQSPQSTIATVPKKSWFHSLFHFKPESFTVYSGDTLHRSKMVIELLLTELGAQYQPSSNGSAIKCKYDGANGQLTAVKFKITMSHAEASNSNIDVNQTNHPLNNKDDAIEVVFTQQQGSLSTFAEFAGRFKQKYNAKAE